MTWITDNNNNRASIERWGSEEAAREALATLTNCSDCSDCYRCSDCYGCYRCSDCYGKKEQIPEIPKIENIHQKIYEAASQPGCLNMDAWHSCETTHCRAGWVVHQAGEAGYALERKTSPVFAAMQIYKASGYEISPCRFFDSNEKALEDMKQLAELNTSTGGNAMGTQRL